MLRVLVADDQPDVLEAARLLLKGEGHLAVTAGSPDAVLKAAAAQPFDLMLLDMNYARDTTSGGEGLDLLHGLRSSGITTPVVVMTAWGSVDLAVEAMRRGACDFVQKPWDNARLIDTIGRYGAQARRARTDLEIARSIQQNLMGRTHMEIPGFEAAARCLPAGVVGGDYFDFLPTPERALGVVLADVSGKGIGAALLMAHLQAAIRSRPELAGSPKQLAESVNRLFWASSPQEQYATVFYGVCQDRGCGNRVMRFISAGHPGAMVLNPDGTASPLLSNGTPIGMFQDWNGDEAEVELAPGARIVLVSDGVLDAGIESGPEFGVEGVLQCLASSRPTNTTACLDELLSSATRRGGSDDMTAVVIHVS